MRQKGNTMETIITSFVYPPIPVRKFDWQAVRDGYEPESNYCVGWGPTEEAAIRDLLEQEYDKWGATYYQLKLIGER